jgi:hypothetical protein
MQLKHWHLYACARALLMLLLAKGLKYSQRTTGKPSVPSLPMRINNVKGQIPLIDILFKNPISTLLISSLHNFYRAGHHPELFIIFFPPVFNQRKASEITDSQLRCLGPPQ